ncbi:Hsp20/alpha crystallin family protein [Fluoribacter dumoffii]|uniref:Spore protein SP21 n=1 Tax=Fluoribacter dumoffii TaxID=463 RepID=A0A377G9J7_9GAMM|nr:Hsp20/alpha crystallin family protein [Fluoribacter dumoffii]KTC90274.1 heat shock protein [Fluoribacter dumoffii NY 23]MCW8385592.1 Hsp20/alpha crystallin family protein [Fluoribacter dumoffii]MCW8418619.1 Hsp20/alpha crystallin family protein [Fluoribacter dumoffii]MCW8453537.1 Hsp20/alpha crystallin family protein [Fluoribacter dumoffii]MCW8459244.1 Hsp20/alpha crystallin family protein [Fluoribacter dumoffii]
MNTLLKWKKGNPLSMEHSQHPFLSLQQEVDRAFHDFYDMFASNKNWEQFEKLNLLPSMDVVEDKDHITIQMEMPGMDEKDINVSFTGSMLTITGEKSTSKKNDNKKYLSREISYGKYERSISLPSTVDIDKAKATFKKGMLWVELPKKAEAKGKSKDIKVEQAK